MPVTDQLNKKQYTADGIQTTFPFPYKFFNASDLQVYLGSTLKTITTDYSVVGIGSSFSQGANVVFSTAPGAGSFITIVRVLPVTQPTDYKDYATFPNEQFNADLDRRTMAEQQIQELGERLISAAVTEPTGMDLELPPSDQWPNQFLGFDAQKKLMVGQPAGAPTSVFMQTVLDDPTAAAARATLDVPTTGDLAALTKRTYTLAAGVTLSAGDVAELLDSQGARRWRGYSVDAGIATGQLTHVNILALSETWVLMVYIRVGTGHRAQMGIILPDDSIAWSGEQIIDAACTGRMRLVKIDDTRVYCDYNVSNVRWGVVLTITGPTIVPGAPVNSTDVANSGGAQGLSFEGCALLEGTTNIFTTNWQATTTLRARIVSILGTVPTFNAPADLTVASTGSPSYTVLNTSPTRLYVVFTEAWVIKSQAYNISATSVATSGSIISSTLSNDEELSGAVFDFGALIFRGAQTTKLVETVPVVRTLGGTLTEGLNMIGGSIDKQSVPIINGPFVQIEQFVGRRAHGRKAFFAYAPGVLTNPRFMWGDVSESGTVRWRLAFRFSATDFTVDGSNQGFVRSAMLSENRAVVVFGVPNVAAKQLYVALARDTECILGIATGNGGEIQHRGIFVTSGLTPMARYYAQKDGTIGVATTPILIGRALSATELQLQMEANL